jgi:hypothetical protein
VYKASSYQVFSRKKLQNLIDQVVFKIQNCLKRYLLMKTARACFSLPCSRKKFVRLFRGAVDISGGEKSDRLYVSLKGPTTAIVTKRLADILGVDCETTPWLSRRYYGREIGRTRDCAYIKIDPSHTARQEILFFHAKKTIYQLDRHGTAHAASIEYLRARIPRHCSSVKPTKHAKEAYKAKKNALNLKEMTKKCRKRKR